MTTTPSSTHFKLGLFVLAAFAAFVVAAFVLGFRASRQPVVTFHTYFNESVTGLDLGAPVKYRGVRIGSVAAIEVAPDHRLVDVGLAIDRDEVARLDLERPDPQLRADLSTLGITGVKFIDFELVAEGSSPPPVLTFAPPPNYVPARSSLFVRLEGRSDELLRETDNVLKGATATLRRVDSLLDEVHAEHLPARIGELADRGTAALGDVRRLVGNIDRADLAAHARASLAQFDETAAALRQTIDRIGGAGGLVETSRHAVGSLEELARRTTGSSEELERTLHDLGDASRAVRAFLDELDREPDMLVKGRAHARGP